MKIWLLIALILGGIFALCYSYQTVYLIYTLFKKPKTYPASARTNRYAVLICARNEQEVIGNLLDSIRKQDYPAERISVFVCADNCTDKTAETAARLGAEVYERRNPEKIGKGYALHDLIDHIFRTYGEDRFDAYLVVDADNLLSPDYITETDRCLSAGNRIVTGYRNTKNFSDNWLSSCYGMWFFHEARQLNNARSLFGVSCAVSGTGFTVHKDVLKELGGWKYFLMIEDVEFSVDMILRGEKIAYCHAAMLYDEQPTSFRQSWHQRLRWCRGYIEVIHHYGGRLIKKIFTGSFSAFDMLVNLAPAYFLSILIVTVNLVAFVVAALTAPEMLPAVLLLFVILCAGGYLMTFFFSFFAALTERDKIHATGWQLFRAVVTFPLFIFTFLPIAVEALFHRRVDWVPVQHTAVLSVDEVEGQPTHLKADQRGRKAASESGHDRKEKSLSKAGKIR